MTQHEKLWIVTACGLAVVLVFAARSWLGEHDLRIRTEATVSAAEKSFDLAENQIRELQDADKKRQEQTAETVAQIARNAASQVTAQQIAAWLPKQLPLPAPITITSPANPTAPAIAEIPAADLAPLRDLVAQSQECNAKLPAAEAALTSCQMQAKLAEDKLAAMTQQRDAYKAQAKGGSFWRRVGKAAKFIAVGAAAGAAIICGSGHCD